MLNSLFHYPPIIATIFSLCSCATAPHSINEIPKIELYGEIHGTHEVPEFFELIVGREAKNYKKLTVGIELTQSEIDSACISIKSKNYAPVTKLGWFGEVQDGRYSRSMARLICNLKRLNNVDLLPLISDNDSALRDKMISDAIVTRASSSDKIVALMGNFHARNSDSSAAGMVRAKGLMVETYVFDARKSSRAWFCDNEGKCGAEDISARFCSNDEELAVVGVLKKDISGGRWDKCVSLDKFTPSLPIGILESTAKIEQ